MPASSRPWIPGGPLCEAPLGSGSCRTFRPLCGRVAEGSPYACESKAPDTLALAVAPTGSTVALFTAQVRAMTAQTPGDYATRQGAYDQRKLRGKQLVTKPGLTRRYHVPGDAARTTTALLTLRDKVIAPSLPQSAHHDEAAHPRTGPPSTATTKPPPRHAYPVQPRRHLHQDSRRIDDILAIAPRQA